MTMVLHLDHFTSKELQLYRESLRDFIDEFIYLAFDDTEDAAYIGIHEIHNAIVDEIDRRKALRDYAFNRISQLRRQLETSTDKVQQTSLMAEITTLELFLRRE